MTSRRVVQRLLNEVLEDIGRMESYRADCTRDGFARDGLRRDATERCLLRIGAAIGEAGAIDPGTARHLAAPSRLLRGMALGGAVDRMDSDVLWGVVELCRTDLRRSVTASLCAVAR